MYQFKCFLIDGSIVFVCLQSSFAVIHKVDNVDDFVQSSFNENTLEVADETNTKLSTLPSQLVIMVELDIE